MLETVHRTGTQRDDNGEPPQREETHVTYGETASGGVRTEGRGFQAAEGGHGPAEDPRGNRVPPYLALYVQ